MSGLEVVIVVGGAIYITKKVREKRERKKLESAAASGLDVGHGRAAEIPPTPNRNTQTVGLRQQVSAEDADPLPLYKAPTDPPPSNTTDMRWSESIHLPTYDELSKSESGKELAMEGEVSQSSNGLLRVPSSQASSSSSTPLAPPRSPSSAETPNKLSTDTNEKKRKFWRRSSSTKASVV